MHMASIYIYIHASIYDSIQYYINQKGTGSADQPPHVRRRIQHLVRRRAKDLYLTVEVYYRLATRLMNMRWTCGQRKRFSYEYQNGFLTAFVVKRLAFILLYQKVF